MPGEIGLVGGEEFRPGCEEMDREVMKASGQALARVVVIPTAAVTGPAKAANDGVRHFEALGGESRPLMVLDRSHADDEVMVQQLEYVGVIYFTGGSPDHLLETLKGSRLMEAISRALARGAVVAGSSAGAMAMGSWMRRPSNGEWVQGLGVAPGLGVLPHHENSDPEETSRWLSQQAPAGVTVLGIDARSGCLGGGGSWRVVGSGNVTVYQGERWTVYKPGERFSTGE